MSYLDSSILAPEWKARSVARWVLGLARWGGGVPTRRQPRGSVDETGADMRVKRQMLSSSTQIWPQLERRVELGKVTATLSLRLCSRKRGAGSVSVVWFMLPHYSVHGASCTQRACDAGPSPGPRHWALVLGKLRDPAAPAGAERQSQVTEK